MVFSLRSSRTVLLGSFIVVSVLMSVPLQSEYLVRGSSPSGSFPFRDDFNYSSISSMVGNEWTQCGQGASQSYNVSSGLLTLRNGAAMCWNHVPAGVSDWTAIFRGAWAYNQHPTSGVEMVAGTTHHTYKFAAGEGSGLVVYRDNVTILSRSGWYPYCVVDGRFCYYTDFGAAHVFRLAMQGRALSAYYDSVLIGTYAEPDAGTDLAMISPMSGSDIGVVWNYVVANSPTTTSVSCTPTSVAVNQAASCTATVTEGFAGATTPVGSVTFSTGGGTFTPSSCPLNSLSSTSASCSVSYLPENCPCYSWQVSTGVRAIAATYSDSTHAGSSGAFSLKVTSLDETNVNVICSPSSVVVNQVSSCSSTVTDISSKPTPPTGSIFEGLGSCQLGIKSGSSASCAVNVTGTQNGSITVNALYGGDSSHYKNENTSEIVVDKRATSTLMVCSPGTVGGNSNTVCTATVTDTDVSTLITPTGSIRFSSNSTGTFNSLNCSLVATSTTGTANCSANYTPSVFGHHLISGSYESLDNWRLWEPGDYTHDGSSGSTQIYADPADPSFSVGSSATFQRVTVTISGTISISSGIVSGTIFVTATNSTTGAVLFSKTFNFSNLHLVSNQTRFLLYIPVGTNPLSADTTVYGAGGTWSATMMVTRQLDIAGRGTVDLVDFGIVASSFNSLIGGSLYKPAADLTGDGTVNIVDICLLSAFYNAPEYS